jgi:M6 family metalloprotease-like protein
MWRQSPKEREGMRPSRLDRAGRRRAVTLTALLALLVAAALGAGPASAGPPPDVVNNPLLQPIDAQHWVDQAELTWDAYKPIRPAAWNSATTSQGSQNQYKTAIILLDFSDQPFLITQAPGTHPFGNPQPGWNPIPQDQVADWMYDYYAVPNEFNGGQTLHAYWMEDSHGKIGVDVTVYGPIRMPGKSFEYGIASDFNNPVNQFCPQGNTCNRNIRTDGGNAWRASIGCASGNCGFDNLFYVTAAHDESSTWQEFGEMLWTDRDQVPAAFGPPGATEGTVLNNLGQPMTNWAQTRYVPWTSWRAAANHWPNAGGGSSTQAESSGQSVFAHEFSHLRGLPDNYNNPFADNERNFTGYWEMMSRGTFNGPGGTHNRWQVPNAGGSGLGPHHMLHFKNQLNVLTPSDQVTIERNTLQDQGVAVVRVKEREAVPNGDLVGLTVNFGTGGDLAGTCANQGYVGADVFYCPNRTGTSYLAYRLEIVNRIGNDSFAPGHGVLISKSRASGTPRVWAIDAHPEDIGMVDFYRPDGTPVAVVRGDPRQLNDATFHAGTNSGSQYEYRDTFNRLHFYVIAKHTDDNGVISYDVGVRRFDGAGPFARGIAVGAPTKNPQRQGFIATCTFPLTNTGQAGTGIFDSDIYRISAETLDDDWDAVLPNALAAVKAGQTAQIPVQVVRNPDVEGDARTTVRLTATSETDSSKTATRTCAVHVKDTTPNAGH